MYSATHIRVQPQLHLGLRNQYVLNCCDQPDGTHTYIKGKGKGHPCTGTEALYRPYNP